MKALILTFLTFLPLAAQAPREARNHRQGRLAEALNLTADQQAKLKALRASHQAAQAPQRSAVQEARAALAKALQDPATPEATLRTLHTRASEAQFQVLLARRAQRAEMRAILTPEQRERAAAFQAAHHERRKGRAQHLRMALRD